MSVYVFLIDRTLVFVSENVILDCTVLYYRGDHRSIGRYDSPWSVLRSDQVRPLRKF